MNNTLLYYTRFRVLVKRGKQQTFKYYTGDKFFGIAGVYY